jgi:hypothetical protein
MNFLVDCRCSPHCVQPAGCAADADTVTHRVFEANGSRLIGSPIKLKEWPANQLTIRNWIAIRGDIAGVERERYDTKLATGILAQAHAVDQSTCGSVFRSAAVRRNKCRGVTENRSQNSGIARNSKTIAKSIFQVPLSRIQKDRIIAGVSGGGLLWAGRSSSHRRSLSHLSR